MKMYMRGQMDNITPIIALLIMVAIGAFVLYEITGSLDFDDQRTATTTALVNTTFTTDASVAWDNASAGDNNVLYWDNWGGTGGISSGDNAVWDNSGPQPAVGARTATTTRWYQSLTVPAGYQGVTSASITGSYLLSDNTTLENCQIAVYLTQPDSTTIPILVLDNTFFTADNSTWQTLDNNVTAYITNNGTYTLNLYDNIDRVSVADGVYDNYVGIVWTTASLSVTTYTQGFGENAVDNVEETGGTTFDLVVILAIVLVAALIIGVVMRAIGGAVGGEGLVAPAL